MKFGHGEAATGLAAELLHWQNGAMQSDGDFGAERAWFVDLEGLRPWAVGGQSEVYERPGKPSQLVKVQTQERLDRPFSTSRWSRTIVREYRAYMDATRTACRLGRPPPLAHMRGFIATNRGLGQVSQKIRDADGHVAPSLKQISRGGALAPEVLDALDRFARDIYDFGIVATDLRPRNIVLEGRGGRLRFVLVDGFSVRTIIPFRRWSRWLNRRKLDRNFLDLGQRIGVAFDVEARRFRPGKIG